MSFPIIPRAASTSPTRSGSHRPLRSSPLREETAKPSMVPAPPSHLAESGSGHPSRPSSRLSSRMDVDSSRALHGSFDDLADDPSDDLPRFDMALPDGQSVMGPRSPSSSSSSPDGSPTSPPSSSLASSTESISTLASSTGSLSAASGSRDTARSAVPRVPLSSVSARSNLVASSSIIGSSAREVPHSPFAQPTPSRHLAPGSSLASASTSSRGSLKSSSDASQTQSQSQSQSQSHRSHPPHPHFPRQPALRPLAIRSLSLPKSLTPLSVGSASSSSSPFSSASASTSAISRMGNLGPNGSGRQKVIVPSGKRRMCFELGLTQSELARVE